MIGFIQDLIVSAWIYLWQYVQKRSRGKASGRTTIVINIDFPGWFTPPSGFMVCDKFASNNDLPERKYLVKMIWSCDISWQYICVQNLYTNFCAPSLLKKYTYKNIQCIKKTFNSWVCYWYIIIPPCNASYSNHIVYTVYY